MRPSFDEMRSRDIMKQGLTARIMRPKSNRLKEIDAALAGRLGYQSEWARTLLLEERATLTTR